MARRNGNRDLDFESDTDAMAREIARLQRENGELAKTILAMESAGMKAPDAPATFLIYLAFLVIGRMALFVWVEKCGDQPRLEAIPANWLFGIGGLALLACWVRREIKATRWLAITKATLVLVAIVLSASIVSNGAVWYGVMVAPAGHPFQGAAVMLGGLLLAASPFCRWITESTLELVTDPAGTVEKIIGRFKDGQ